MDTMILRLIPISLCQNWTASGQRISQGPMRLRDATKNGSTITAEYERKLGRVMIVASNYYNYNKVREVSLSAFQQPSVL